MIWRSLNNISLTSFDLTSVAVCGLVTGEVAVGVLPALPVEGVDIILGNDPAGNRAWAHAPPPNVITQVPVPLP